MNPDRSDETSHTPIAVFIILLVAFCGSALLVSAAPSANGSADDVMLPTDHGYVLIRITMNTRFEIADRDRLVFKSYDADESFNVRLKTRYSAGVNSYISLISVAAGHYFCDQYLPETRSVHLAMPRPCPRLGRNNLSADDLFEVKSGVINFVGDWDVTSLLSWIRDAEFPTMDVGYDMATIKRSTAHFPDQLGKYQVFISYKGKKAISLNDLAELSEHNSGSGN